MLQRINLALMIIVILIVGAVSLQVFTTQRYNTLALQAITTELANMKTTAQSEAKMGHVIVEGDLDKPGRYAFSLEGSETLADLFKKIGVGREKYLFDKGNTYKVSSILDSKYGFRILRDGEEYRIYDEPPKEWTGQQDPSLLEKLPGKWQQIDENGNAVPDGIVLNITDPNDFMNLYRSTYCKIDHPAILAAVHVWQTEDSSFNPARVILTFDSPNGRRRADYLDITLEEDYSGKQTRQMGVPGNGRWQIKKNGHLYLNLGTISPQPGKPLIFEKVK